MDTFFVDLHIHIGRDWNGKPVKITGSKSLTLSNILEEATNRKGLDMVGVIDAQAPSVQEEMLDLIDRGKAVELKGGGIRYQDTVLLLGSEIEVYDAACSGPIHVLCYFPTVNRMRAFTAWLSHKMKNVNLSSQRFYGTARELQQYVKDHEGIFIPAHVFTPFKSLYGKGVKETLREVLDPDKIDAVELGLSADTGMADLIGELEPYTYVTNSDAHSLGKLAREYQQMTLKALNFEELQMALHNQQGRKVLTNYGMSPAMGKYHQTVCAKCLAPAELSASHCEACGSRKIVKGVNDRVQELKSSTQKKERPPYVYQVPLSSLPGVGTRTYEKLIKAFGTEMAVIHEVSREQLTAVIPEQVVERIIAMRKGTLTIQAGGGGRYGRIQ
ncbi:endonuclease Q family protein [Halobacillus sp. Nhm2S1]|uniref:endonuclease Q family protein n=1 Tax=Halobacillus sp. Nhm2S1 TaxID=2866716 RepID=UPI001C73B34B|nr:endonuclease Q family protein [Halobacillus sp. Nhm2S1]MBX0356140.1 endonuclease Q family protein [Halobacillus sp. Nhm2S1]